MRDEGLSLHSHLTSPDLPLPPISPYRLCLVLHTLSRARQRGFGRTIPLSEVNALSIGNDPGMVADRADELKNDELQLGRAAEDIRRARQVVVVSEGGRRERCRW